MTPITQEQQERLEGFTEQRDALVTEISALAKERDSLVRSNNEYNTANSLLTTEIAENERRIIESRETTGVSINQLKNDQYIAQHDLESTLEKRDDAKRQLDEAFLNLAEVVKQVMLLENFLVIAEQKIKDVTEQVQNNAAAIAQKAERVDYTVRELEDIVRVFHEKYIAKEVAVAKKYSELEKRETYLNEREEAINVTYHEIVETMNKNGQKLPDLHSKGVIQS